MREFVILHTAAQEQPREVGPPMSRLQLSHGSWRFIPSARASGPPTGRGVRLPCNVVKPSLGGGDAQEIAKTRSRMANLLSSVRFSARNLVQSPHHDTLVTRQDTQEPMETWAVAGLAETHGDPTGGLDRARNPGKSRHCGAFSDFGGMPGGAQNRHFSGPLLAQRWQSWQPVRRRVRLPLQGRKWAG